MLTSDLSWQDLLERYRTYRTKPVWGSMRRIPDRDGRLKPEDEREIVARGGRAAGRAKAAMEKFARRTSGLWPATPAELVNNQALFDSLLVQARVGREGTRNFWEALIFARDGYSCAYCRRQGFAFHEVHRRALWLVVDHITAVGQVRNTFEFANSATACWTCNTIKGPLPVPAFEAELDALVDARMAWRAAKGA